MADNRHQFMTDEQTRTPQVKMVVNLFLNGNAGYTAVQPNRLYRKSDGAGAAAGISAEPVPAATNMAWQCFCVIKNTAVAPAVTEFSIGLRGRSEQPGYTAGRRMRQVSAVRP
jgi:hypothetical protein